MQKIGHAKNDGVEGVQYGVTPFLQTAKLFFCRLQIFGPMRVTYKSLNVPNNGSVKETLIFMEHGIS
jgi:hypothetical protein